MTYKEVSEMISGIGLPYAYYQFPDNTELQPPFIVELYTDNKDFALEQTVEDALNGSGLVYSRNETYLDTEKMNMVTYTTEIVITKENDNA